MSWRNFRSQHICSGLFAWLLVPIRLSCSKKP
nr:MAG TPA: hypothetical protein [Caudoviricetes sp.]